MLMLISSGCATSGSQRFTSCENNGGDGFFWMDSTSGKLWWADKQNSSWKYCGTPEDAEAGFAGRYILNENKKGPGVFVLDTKTGNAWWSNTIEWRVYGTPEEK